MTKLTMSRRILLLAEVIAFALLAVASSSHFGMADGLRITASFLVAYLVPCLVLSRVRGTSTTARVVLLVLFVLLAVVSCANLLRWTQFEECTLQYPDLKSDARNFYKWALFYSGYPVEETTVIFPGFPLMIVALWKVFGLSVVWPLAMNMMFTLTSVVLTGMTTRRLLVGRVSVSHRSLLYGGMMLTCLLLFYLMMGVAILKEPSTYLSVSLVGFALSSMATVDEERHHLWRDVVIFVLGCALLAFVRSTFLYFLALGVVIMALPHWRRDWKVALGMLAVLLVALLLGDYFASYSFSRHAEIVGGGWNMQRFFVMTDSQKIYHDLLNYYFLYSNWHKAAMLPLTMSVQFFIPFPWLIYEEPVLANYITRCTVGWYMLGGVALFYYLFMSWRRQDNMGMWAWWAAAVYAVIAYVMAGSMARYVTPFQPLFVPVAMYVLCRLIEGPRWRKPFWRWTVCFVILVGVALAIAYELQTSSISTMLHTRPLEDVMRDVLVMAEK